MRTSRGSIMALAVLIAVPIVAIVVGCAPVRSQVDWNSYDIGLHGEIDAAQSDSQCERLDAQGVRWADDTTRSNDDLLQYIHEAQVLSGCVIDSGQR